MLRGPACVVCFLLSSPLGRNLDELSGRSVPSAVLPRPLLRSHPVLMAASRKGDSKPSKRLSSKAPPEDIEKLKHLYFDEVEVVVRSGNGGDGAVIALPARGEGPRLKRTSDDDFELPPGGGAGGNVVLFVDPALSDLLHLRGRPVLVAPRGGDSQGLRDLPAARERWRALVEQMGNSGSAGSAPGGVTRAGAAGGVSSVKLREGEVLRIPVPPGTFVRTKSGKVLGDLVAPRQELIVAVGGEGGPCVLNQERKPRDAGGRSGKGSGRRGSSRTSVPDDPMAAFDNVDEDAFAPSEDELLGLTRGRPAQEVALSLVLRTVADVGFVGFPNAGKSTLLGALSRATPEVAPFPFTTLMPNLGAMQQASASPSASTAATAASTRSPMRAPPVLADLPGLVEDAHQGRGLGRLFLRHLRRVRVVLYVLDTNCKEPSVGEQYDVLKRELRLYNPQYLERPHVVALNKLDIPLEADGEEAMKLVQREATRAIAVSAGRSANETAAPVAVVPISGMRRKGIRILKEALEKALDVADDVE